LIPLSLFLFLFLIPFISARFIEIFNKKGEVVTNVYKRGGAGAEQGRSRGGAGAEQRRSNFNKKRGEPMARPA